MGNVSTVENAGTQKLKILVMASIRSKHNNLLNYFICDHRHLSKAYVRKCKKFFKEFRAANASSVRRIEKTQSVTEPLIPVRNPCVTLRERAGRIPPALKHKK